MRLKEYVNNVWCALKGEAPVKVVKVPDLNLTRHALGSISTEDIVYMEKLDQEELLNHEAEMATIVHNNAFKREIAAMKYTQIMWMAKEADGDRQHLFGKGTLNGISLVEEGFRTLASRHSGRIANQNEKGTFGSDVGEPIGSDEESTD
jgi:hypothetical protein